MPARRVAILMFIVSACLMHGVSPCALAQPQAAAAVQQASSARGVYTLPPEKLKTAIEYTRRRIVLDFAEPGWQMVQLALLLVAGAAAWMERAALRAGRNRWAQGYVFFFLLLAVTSVLSLPLEMYGHHLSLAYGQSVQGWGSWFADEAKSFLLSYLVGGLLVMVLFYVIRRSPKRWWFWFWFPAMGAVVFGVFLAPILIDPMYYRFEPLERSDPALVERLERIVARGGISIPPERMVLMKASEKVTGLNAYVTGIGASKRVVVWDTTIAKATPDEISLIFGHEMGHYVLNHIYKGIAFTGGLLLVVFWTGYRSLNWLLRRYGAAWGIAGQDEWGALVALMLVGSVLSFLSEPVVNGFSRAQEHAADVYGLEAVHGIVADPRRTGVQTFQLLGEESLVDPTPRPFVEFGLFSHPPIASRAAFAAGYDPWAAGREPKYFKR